jgi:hypothetical protein
MTLVSMLVRRIIGWLHAPLAPADETGAGADEAGPLGLATPRKP